MKVRVKLNCSTLINNQLVKPSIIKTTVACQSIIQLSRPSLIATCNKW